MKRLCIILLSVMVFALAGCNSTNKEMTEAENSYAETQETEETKEPVVADSGEEDISTDKETELQDADNEDSEAEDSETSDKEETANQSNSESRNDSTSRRENTTASTEEREETQATVQAPEPEPTPESTPEPTPAPEPTPTYTPAAYSPGNVVSLAIAKCQAGGMITTQDNLANALAEGRITQEEYNEYYPYDGLESSYYSVFVETDLNTASTTSGQPLRSEDAIATYIADMLLLEQSPIFNVVYAGVYSRNGTDFYEFRCLR